MTSPPRAPNLRWRAWLGAGMVLGLLTFALSPKMLTRLGMFDPGMWFLDSYAILAAGDTVRAGGDPVQPMALDVGQRAHVYSDWWYGVRWLGLTRDDNFLLGGLWVAAFSLAAWMVLRPQGARETGWYLALFLSPPILLAINRANNDLVIFALLVAAACLFARQTPLRLAGALALLVLATGLKYYPIVGGAIFLLVRPRARLIASLLAALIVLGAVLAQVAPAMARVGLHPVPTTIHVFGAPVLLRDFGWEGSGALAGGVAIVVALVAGSVFWRDLRTMDSSRAPVTQAAFVLGAAVLAGCFLTGISFAYRGMFLLLVAPWLWEQRNERPDAKLAIWLVTAVLWLEGLACLAINSFVGPMDAATISNAGLAIRFITQPLAWILMVLLIRWLLEVAVAAWRTSRTTGNAAG